MEQYVRAKAEIKTLRSKEVDIKAVIGMVVSRGVCDLEDILALNDYIVKQKEELKEVDKFVQIVEKVNAIERHLAKDESLRKSISELTVSFDELKEKINNIEKQIDEKEKVCKKDIEGE